MKNFSNKKPAAWAPQILLLVFLFLISVFPAYASDVTSEQCVEAYHRCLDYYMWAGPFAFAYCGNGLVFCLLFL